METWIINKHRIAEPTKGLETIIKKAADTVAEVCGLNDNCEVSVFLTDNQYIHELNYLYCGKNYPTDVLSFAMQEKGVGEPNFDFPEDENILGDIVISVEKAEEQSKEYGHSFERELVYLTVHGFLHLLGYSHEKEPTEREMRRMEELVLEALNLGR